MKKMTFAKFVMGCTLALGLSFGAVAPANANSDVFPLDKAPINTMAAPTPIKRFLKYFVIT